MTLVSPAKSKYKRIYAKDVCTCPLSHMPRIDSSQLETALSELNWYALDALEKKYTEQYYTRYGVYCTVLRMIDENCALDIASVVWGQDRYNGMLRSLNDSCKQNMVDFALYKANNAAKTFLWVFARSCTVLPSPKMLYVFGRDGKYKILPLVVKCIDLQSAVAIGNPSGETPCSYENCFKTGQVRPCTWSNFKPMATLRDVGYRFERVPMSAIDHLIYGALESDRVDCLNILRCRGVPLGPILRRRDCWAVHAAEELTATRCLQFMINTLDVRPKYRSRLFSLECVWSVLVPFLTHADLRCGLSHVNQECWLLCIQRHILPRHLHLTSDAICNFYRYKCSYDNARLRYPSHLHPRGILSEVTSISIDEPDADRVMSFLPKLFPKVCILTTGTDSCRRSFVL